MKLFPEETPPGFSLLKLNKNSGFCTKYEIPVSTLSLVDFAENGYVVELTILIRYLQELLSSRGYSQRYKVKKISEEEEDVDWQVLIARWY